MAKQSITSVSALPPNDNYGRNAGDIKPPKYATVKPVESGDVPRVIDPLDRAVPGGPRRYKLACRNYREPSPKPVRYILANDEEEAKVFYRKLTKVDESLTTVARPNLKTGQMEYVALEPEIVCSALAD